MYIILCKELQKILLTAFSDSLEITLDVVINIMSLNATEYILFYFKNLQYHYEVTYWGFYLNIQERDPMPMIADFGYSPGISLELGTRSNFDS